MKNIMLGLCFTTLLTGSGAYAQCGEDRQIVQFDSVIVLNVLLDYLGDAYKNKAARVEENKGIFEIIEYTDAKQRRCLSLRTFIDDRYKDKPPLKWAYFFMGHVFLYYEGDVNGKAKVYPRDEEFMKCLEIIVADRVYQRVPSKQRYTQVYDEMGKKYVNQVDTNKKAMLGNDAHNVIYVFEKDGKISRLRPA